MKGNSLDFFQLQNLINHQVAFLFFDFSQKKYDSFQDVNAKSVFEKAQKKSLREVKKLLAREDKRSPVVLVCEDGKQSAGLAEELSLAGFVNVFFLSGGVKNL